MTRLIDADALINKYQSETTVDVFRYEVIEDLNNAPTVEPTLYGYKIEHLALIARVMQKDGVTPERAVQIFKNVQTIALKVIDEINGAVEQAFEQVTEVRGSEDGKAD